MTRKPRPICPNCGSVDMAVFKKYATCNRCHKHCQREAAFVHVHRPEMVPENRNSVAPINRRYLNEETP